MRLNSQHTLYQRLLKKFYLFVVYPFIGTYIKNERTFRHGGFKMRVFPGVFHPGFFFSTKVLYSFINKLDLERKSCLEVGCGSGLLSLLMCRKGGMVTALDINEKAVKNTELNFQLNRSQFHSPCKVVQSDLFDNLTEEKFQVVIIAPPFFFTDPSNQDQYAWFCGKNGEYFEKLFSQLPAYIDLRSQIYMSLADNCDIERINNIAASHGFTLKLIFTKRIWWEDNFIFEICPLPA